MIPQNTQFLKVHLGIISQVLDLLSLRPTANLVRPNVCCSIDRYPQSCQAKRLLLDQLLDATHAFYLPGAWSASFETNCQSCQTKRPLLDWQISWILPGEAPVAWSTKIIHMIRPAKDAMCKAIRLTKDTQRCFALIKMQYARQCASISLY